MKKIILTICILSLSMNICLEDYFSNSKGASLNSTSTGGYMYSRERLESERNEAIRNNNYSEADNYNKQIDLYNRNRNTHPDNFYKNMNRIY